MAAITVTNKVDGVSASGKRTVTATLGAGTSGDTIASNTVLGLRKIDKVYLDITATFPQDEATYALTTNANTAGATYVFVGS